MKGKKKKADNENLDVTALQCVPKKRHGGANAKTSETRAKFLDAFEKTFGNISASCVYSGISRRTFYRWMKSASRINQKFQAKLEMLKPKERQVDFLEGMLMKRAAQGDTTAIIFGLKTQGKHRGYGDSPVEVNVNQIDQEVLELKKKIEQVAAQFGTDYKTELQIFLKEFSNKLRPEIKTQLSSELVN